MYFKKCRPGSWSVTLHCRDSNSSAHFPEFPRTFLAQAVPLQWRPGAKGRLPGSFDGSHLRTAKLAHQVAGVIEATNGSTNLAMSSIKIYETYY